MTGMISPRSDDGRRAVDTVAVALQHRALSPDLVIEGAQTSGSIELGAFGDATLGVWEITPGASRDVEADEVFLVIGGEGTLRIDGEPDAIELRPGVLVLLEQGMQTEWRIRRTLRKLYIVR